MNAQPHSPAAGPNGTAPAGPDSPPGSLPWRLAALETLLDRAGVAWSGVRAAGPEREIAVVEAPPTELGALAGLAREIRALGFRFVTLDLAAQAPASTRAAPEVAPGAEPVATEGRR